MQNPIQFHANDISSFTKLSKAMLLALIKVMQVCQLVALSKWFSRKWFPFFISIWFLAGNLADFSKRALTKEKQYDENGDLKIDVDDEKKAALYGIVSCILAIGLSIVMLNYYSIDPMD